MSIGTGSVYDIERTILFPISRLIEEYIQAASVCYRISPGLENDLVKDCRVICLPWHFSDGANRISSPRIIRRCRRGNAVPFKIQGKRSLLAWVEYWNMLPILKKTRNYRIFSGKITVMDAFCFIMSRVTSFGSIVYVSIGSMCIFLGNHPVWTPPKECAFALNVSRFVS